MNPLGNASKKQKKEVCHSLYMSWANCLPAFSPCRNPRTSGSVSTLSSRSVFRQSDVSLATGGSRASTCRYTFNQLG